MDDVADMVNELITAGYVSKPLLGVSVDDVPQSVQAYGVPKGAAVLVVTPGLPGEKAGLKEGDIITKIGETEVTTADELITAKNQYEVGDTVTLTVYRGGEILTVDVTLEESTPEKEALQEKAQQEYREKYQKEQQKQQGNSYGYNWPFIFGY